MTFHEVTGTIARAPCVAHTPKASGAGPYGWLTPYIETIAAHNSGVAARVLRLRREELHFIACCLSLMSEKRDDADHLAAFARGVGVLSSKTLVTSCAIIGGIEINGGIAKVVGKLAGAPWRPASYLRLVALMNDRQARKTISHLPRVSRRRVILLSRLPKGYRTIGVAKAVRKGSKLSELVFAIDMVRRARPELDDRQIIASLEKAKVCNARTWVMRHLERIPFPEAPAPAQFINGVEAIRPLATYDDLKRAALEFDNCIRTYLWSVLKGDSYFYRYAPKAGGKGVAVIELRRAPIIGWVVHEALGPENDEINGVDRASIVAAFRRAGIAAAPQAASADGWFDIG